MSQYTTPSPAATQRRKTDAELCWCAAYDDLATRSSMRTLIVPALRREVAELRLARIEARDAGCLDTWRACGLIADEINKRAALQHARRVLESFARAAA